MSVTTSLGQNVNPGLLYNLYLSMGLSIFKSWNGLNPVMRTVLCGVRYTEVKLTSFFGLLSSRIRHEKSGGFRCQVRFYNLKRKHNRNDGRNRDQDVML